jgi:hypothetical protein
MTGMGMTRRLASAGGAVALCVLALALLMGGGCRRPDPLIGLWKIDEDETVRLMRIDPDGRFEEIHQEPADEDGGIPITTTRGRHTSTAEMLTVEIESVERVELDGEGHIRARTSVRPHERREYGIRWVGEHVLELRRTLEGDIVERNVYRRTE